LENSTHRTVVKQNGEHKWKNKFIESTKKSFQHDINIDDLLLYDSGSVSFELFLIFNSF